MACITELVEIVGEENVAEDVSVLQSYAKDHSFVKGVMPQCVVKANNLEHLQAIIRWAGQKSMPLIPVSSGEPHFRGDTVPSLGGVILDLSGMDKIIRIDRRNRVAMIEPGVTFAQLEPELRKEGLKLPMPLYPRSSKSVACSFLEREPITIPKYHLDMSEPMLCTEVTFGTGDVLRTGEAAGPGSIEEQWKFGKAQTWDKGPGQLGFTRLIQGCQGGMGIITWATVRCEVLPQIHELLLIPAQRIESLIDFVYQALKFRLGDECLLLNDLDLASLLANGIEVSALRDKLSPWTLLLGIAGYDIFPEERVKYQKEDIMDVAHRFGLSPVAALPGVNPKEVLRVLTKPCPEPYWKLGFKGDCYDTFFLTTLDKTPVFIDVMHRMCDAHQYPLSQLGIYIQPIQRGESCHCEFNLMYDPTDEKELANVRKLALSASEALVKEGAFFSRPYGHWAEMVYNRDAGTKEAVRKLKAIFDPYDILNPGKLC